MTNFSSITKSSNNINYYQKSIDEINQIKKENRRPKILLHACCAPCSTFPLEFLNDVFDCTILYNNSNIYPSEEYDRRLNELKRYLQNFNYQHIYPVTCIEAVYDNESYTKKLEPLKDYPEGSIRCLTCYTCRMQEAYQYASDNNFDYFTTVMTISRQKDSQKINAIGSQLETKYPNVKYFYSDFKKKKGIDRAQELSTQHHLYRQEYCGCIYSYHKYLKRKV